MYLEDIERHIELGHYSSSHTAHYANEGSTDCLKEPFATGFLNKLRQ